MPLKVSKKILKTVKPYIRDEWSLPDKISVSDWADLNRRLDVKTSAEPGQWNTSRTPYLRGIMDAFSDPFVE